jgi:stearoyl-CoA desaturase (delta-9 desaturase)
MMNIEVPGSLQLTGSEALKNRLTAGLGVGIPTVATIAALFLLHFGIIHFTWVDFAISAFMYTLTGLGVTVGLHRLFGHRSFETGPRMQALFAITGIMALQGNVTGWVACHRRHHRYSDQPGDPHSPVKIHGGTLGAIRALFFVHVSRLFLAEDTAVEVYASDMCKNATIQRVDRLALVWIFLTLAIPAMAGWIFSGGISGALTAMLWGGPVRIFFGQHVGSCVNSLCHMFGQVDYDTGDASKNNAWIGIAAFGEGWHNNHHAFPASARQGLRWWQLDLSYVVIRTLAALGLAWNVKLPTAEQMARRRLAPATAPALAGSRG